MGEQRFTAQQRWVLGLTAAASFIAVLDGMVVTTALDSIRQDLTAPLSFLHWPMTVYSLSFASLLMAGAGLGDRFGHRSMFVFGLLLATAFLATLKIQSNDRVMSKVDLPDVVLLTIAMTAIVWGLSEGNAIGWSSPAIASALAISTASAIAFFVCETKAFDALVPGRLMQSIPFRAGNLVCLLMFMSMMGTLIFMAQYFAITQQTSASGAGGRMTPWTVSLFVVAPISGILTSRLGERLPAVTGLLLQSAALMWMSFLCKSASGYGAWVPPLILAGVGISLAMPAVQSAVLGSVAPRDMGKASGIYNTMRQLGWACGAAAAVAIFSASGSLAAAETVSNGYAAVLQLTAALSAMGALVSLKLPSAVQANVRAAAPAVSSPE